MTPQQEIEILKRELRESQARFYDLKGHVGSALMWMNTGHTAEAKNELKAGQKV